MKKALTLLVLLLLVPFLTSANAIQIAWSAYLPIHFSGNTIFQSSQLLYFSSFKFGTNSLLFKSIYIGSGSTISSLNVSCIGANLTFNQLSQTGETSFTAQANGATTISLQGFGANPDNVKIGNASLPFVYTVSNDTLTVTPSFVGSQDIVLDYPTTSSQNAMAVAVVALLVGFSIGALAFIFVLRARRENEQKI